MSVTGKGQGAQHSALTDFLESLAKRKPTLALVTLAFLYFLSLVRYIVYFGITMLSLLALSPYPRVPGRCLV